MSAWLYLKPSVVLWQMDISLVLIKVQLKTDTEPFLLKNGRGLLSGLKTFIPGCTSISFTIGSSPLPKHSSTAEKIPCLKTAAAHSQKCVFKAPHTHSIHDILTHLHSNIRSQRANYPFKLLNSDLGMQCLTGLVNTLIGCIFTWGVERGV